MLLWQSILVGLQIMAGGAVLGEFVDGRWVGLLVLSVGALQGATAYFQRGLGIDPHQLASSPGRTRRLS